jgi:hypothetical protein
MTMRGVLVFSCFIIYFLIKKSLVCVGGIRVIQVMHVTPPDGQI